MSLPGLLVFLVLVSGAGRVCAEWMSLDARLISSADGPLTLLLDKESIASSDDVVTVTFRMYWGAYSIDKQNKPGMQINSTFDCKRRRSNINSGVYVDGANGKFLPGQISPTEFRSIPADTASELVFNHVCSKKWYQIWK